MNFLIIAISILGFHYNTVHCFSLAPQCRRITCADGSLCVVDNDLRPYCKKISTKPGVCSAGITNPECLTLRGAPGCLFDSDCNGARTKCCASCCQEATTEKQLAKDRNPGLEKPGSCPPSIGFVAYEWFRDLFCPRTGIIDDCQNDAQCHDDYKCCSSLCGKECLKPIPDNPAAARTEATTTTATTTTTEPPTTTAETFTESDSRNFSVASNITIDDQVTHQSNESLDTVNGTDIVLVQNITTTEIITEIPFGDEPRNTTGTKAAQTSTESDVTQSKQNVTTTTETVTVSS